MKSSHIISFFALSYCSYNLCPSSFDKRLCISPAPSSPNTLTLLSSNDKPRPPHGCGSNTSRVPPLSVSLDQKALLPTSHTSGLRICVGTLQSRRPSLEYPGIAPGIQRFGFHLLLVKIKANKLLPRSTYETYCTCE